MNFYEQNKAFLVMAVVTILLVIGGVFFFSRPPAPVDNSRISSEILAPEESYKTATGSAEITLVEFGDYQCPACGSYHPLVKRLLAELGTQINFVFRNFPLTQHQNAPAASYAAEAAGLQGKYWDMHALLYENQNQWESAGNPKEIFIEYAKKLSLNEERFKADMDSNAVKDKVNKDRADGNLVKINATPTFFVNGLRIDAPPTYDQFKELVLSSK